MAEETKRQLRKPRPSYRRVAPGIPVTEAQKQRLREVNTGKRYSDEVNHTKGRQRFGEANPMFGKSAWVGREHKEESRQRMREAWVRRKAR